MGAHGQVVAIVAEAGAGKSRLVYEFKSLLPTGCELLQAYSVSYGKASAWLPVLELLRGYFGIETADDAAARREKVRITVAALDPGLNDTLPYLWGLFGIQEMPDPLAQMDPQIRQRRTRDAIKRIILSESLTQPIVLIFEDLHWIDSETQALLDLLTDSIAGIRLLLLVNYRPEYRHEWSSRAHYLQLRLDQLGGESATSMLDDLLGNGADLDSLKHQVTDRAGGKSLFHRGDGAGSLRAGHPGSKWISEASASARASPSPCHRPRCASGPYRPTSAERPGFIAYARRTRP
jgi:predicted ATPase